MKLFPSIQANNDSADLISQLDGGESDEDFDGISSSAAETSEEEYVPETSR